MYLDMHNHFVFGVDDGADDMEESVRMLRQAVENGVSQIISTPHCVPGVEEFNEKIYRDNLNLS